MFVRLSYVFHYSRMVMHKLNNIIQYAPIETYTHFLYPVFNLDEFFAQNFRLEYLIV